MSRAAIAAAALLAVYLARLDDVAGLIVDDAWYVLLARAIAEGDGYALTSSALAPIVPSVPPGFPLLLAPVFLLSPDFPANVWLLKGVSVAAMMATSALAWRYARAQGLDSETAGLVAVATALTPGLVFLATSTVMAECAFACCQLAAVLLVGRSLAGDAGREWPALVTGALAAAAALLVRTAGIAVVSALVLALVWERRWRQALVFACVVLVCVAPWAIYSRAHPSTREQRAAHGGSIAYGYAELLRMRRGGLAASGEAGPEELLASLPGRVVDVLGRDVAGIVVPTLLRGASESGLEVVALGGPSTLMPGSMGNTAATVALSLALSAVIAVGLAAAVRRRPGGAPWVIPATIAMVLVVPSRSFRYVLPLSPLLLVELARGARVLGRARGTRVARVLLLVVVGLFVAEHGLYVVRRQAGPPPEWIADAREADDLLRWMRERLRGEGAVASTNPAMVYLHTGRKGVASDDPRGNWTRWRAAGVRWVAALRHAPLPPASLGYRVVYRSARHGLWVIEI